MTRFPRAFPILLLLAALILGGCIGDDAPKTADARVIEKADDAVVTEDTGSITGQILTADLEPIVDQLVNLTLDINGSVLRDTRTDTQGRFTFNGIPPGRYLVQADPRCCDAFLAEVVVAAGSVSEVSKMLERTIVLEPYIAEYEWSGFIACAIHGRPMCTSDPKHAHAHNFEVHKGLTTLVIGVQWTPAGGLSTSDELWLSVYKGNYDYAKALGHSPLRLVIDDTVIRNDAHSFANFSAEEPTTLRFDMEGPQLQVSYQQDFTIYWQEYYHMTAPENANPVPDG